jgi:cell division protein FtsI (penicillin-binding protein 3)
MDQDCDPVAGAKTVVSFTERNPVQRVGMEKTQLRLLTSAAGFCFLFGAVSIKLAIATVLMPMVPANRQIAPSVPQIPVIKSDPHELHASEAGLPFMHRASITDRNGQILAISRPMASVFAKPLELIDPADAAAKLKTVLPKLDVADTVRKLSQKKQFIYIARQVSPEKQLAINNLGIPGIYFEPVEKRYYPMGRTAAQIMGAVDVDDHGVGGIERYFDKRLSSDATPLRLSLDVRVQRMVRDELLAAKNKFSAIGACAIVMDVRTGEIVSMVSLPDYDSNLYNKANDDERFNRAVTGMYEPGSTFKLQTAAMVIQDGIAHVWNQFSTRPIHVGRFTIADMSTDHFPAYVAIPHLLAVSSNPAAAHMALGAGATRQQDWLRNMGFFERVPVELPEAARPLLPRLSSWGTLAVMTVAFGHGIAVPPLAIVRGTAAIANGGVLVKPTLLARTDRRGELGSQIAAGLQAAAFTLPVDKAGPAEPPLQPQGVRVISEFNSALLRKMLRLVVHSPIGSGQTAEVPGYFVGGKTGTAEKVAPHGGYLKHVNISAFTAVFPMNAPRYAVYVMLDSPKATPDTHGWTTAMWTSAPTVGKIIARVGPILDVLPNNKTDAQVDHDLAIPLDPTVPAGFRALGPGNNPGDPSDVIKLPNQ